MSNYPSFNDRDFDLLKKMTNSLADIATNGGGGGGAVSSLVAGTGISLSPVSGLGNVTITATGGAANAITAASAAASSGLLWVSAGSDRSASATNTVAAVNATSLAATNFTFNGVSVTAPTGAGAMVLGTA